MVQTVEQTHVLKQKPFYLQDQDIEWVEKTIAGMTEEEKVQQLFCLVTYTSDESFLKKMAQLKPAGVMLRAMPMKDAAECISILQKHSTIPMLVAANLEEGGNGIVTEGTRFGSEMLTAATNDDEMAYKLGMICGREGAAVGANWSFGPIVDIDFNFRNPITNTRTFGSDPDRVSRMGVQYIKGIQQYGVAAAVKHFPGDGVDERDQHLVTSVNSMSCDEWDQTFGKVYKDCIDAGAMSVMVGHIMQPAYSRKLNPALNDENIQPATLSYEIVTGLLKEQLGFNGLVVTDASTMAGMMTTIAREQAVPQAIAAGCDIFLFTRNMEEDMKYMKKGVEEGIITEERLHNALLKILGMKAALGLHQKQENCTLVPDFKEAAQIIGVPEHAQWANEAADRSITLVKHLESTLPLAVEKHKRVLLCPIESGDSFFAAASSNVKDTMKELFEKEGFEVTLFDSAVGMEGILAPYEQVTERYDLIVYVANLATKSNQTVVRIEWEQPLGINVPIHMVSVPTVFISVENPYHLLDVPRVKTFINTYSASPLVLEHLMEKLMGRSEFKGVSPVDPFCGKWDTRL